MLNNKKFSMIQHLLTLYQKTNTIFSISSSSSSSSSSIIVNSTMKKLMDSGQYRNALVLFDEQAQMNTDFDINMALKACTKLHDYERGIKMEQQLSSHSRSNLFIQTSLIHFYMQCHDIDNANRVFSTITYKTNAIYGAMFKGFISNKMPEKLFDLLDKMVIEPDDVNLNFIFNACAQLNNARAMRIGNKFLREKLNQIRNNNIVLNSAIHMLMKFRDIRNAEHIFEMIKKKDIFSYSSMMKGYVENNMPEKALNLFERMPLNPNDIIYIVTFNACSKLANGRAIEIGNKILNQSLKQFKNNYIVLNSALHMLMRFNDIQRAEHLFELIEKKDIFTYGIMMNGYNINDEPIQSVKIFERMKKDNIIPDEIAYTILISACSQIGMSSMCQLIIDQIPLYLKNKPYIYSSLIDMWGKVGSIKNAEQIFQSISNPDVIANTAMINAYGLNGMGLEAVQLYRQIPRNLLNDVSHVCVLNACSHSGLLDHARSIFNEIIVKTEKITAIMIDCLSRLFLFDEAQKVLDDYEKLNSPSLSMYMAMLSGARNSRDSVLSQRLYNRMKSLFSNKKDDLIAASILLCNTYSSLGQFEQATHIRSTRIKEFGKNVKVGLTWTEANGELVQFKAHDRSHRQSQEIYAELDRMSAELIEYGHKYDSSWITRPVKEDESVESILCSHSEKLAIAFNFIQRPVPSIIQITKNLRICGDCHQATKLIAKIRKCEIIVRDANRIHHFYSNGQCSCQDHF
ncbi:unnamed protein product [Rotaria magnacalcarata]|uniref:DYW domain-containing protein n=2 Tax=Rotaria magnacalcarata TaxID=392030 RepID=A0A814YEI2_9BILA|nr:unnamed protein product [Rotaria magnacalcarata]